MKSLDGIDKAIHMLRTAEDLNNLMTKEMILYELVHWRNKAYLDYNQQVSMNNGGVLLNQLALEKDRAVQENMYLENEHRIH